MNIIPLEQAVLENAGQVGSKALNLSIAASMGLKVPSGFCIITRAANDFFLGSGLLADITALGNSEEISESSLAGIREELKKTPISLEFTQELRAAYQRLRIHSRKQLACRSSAVEEDLPNASFAGQYYTKLGISRFEELQEAVRGCWLSVLNQHVIQYRKRMGFPGIDLSMAVLVQQLVNSESAGVVFSQDPSGSTNEILVEGSWGLGEAVVSGTADTYRYIVNRESGAILKGQQHPAKGLQIEPSGHGAQGNVRPLLNAEQIKELWEATIALEHRFQKLVDIEFAFEKTRRGSRELSILQCRPLTGEIRGKDERDTKRIRKNLEVLAVGTGISKGMYTGRSRYIPPGGGSALQEGEILITRKLTIDLYPAMFRSGAIVVEDGSLVNHACTVTRELGIPCVIDVKNCSSIFREGQEICVDGTDGEIYSLSHKQSIPPRAAEVSAKISFAISEIESLSFLEANQYKIGFFDIYPLLAYHIATQRSASLDNLSVPVSKVIRLVKQHPIQSVRLWMPEEGELKRLLDPKSWPSGDDPALSITALQLKLLLESGLELRRLLLPPRPEILQEAHLLKGGKPRPEIWIDASLQDSIKPNRNEFRFCTGVCIHPKQGMRTNEWKNLLVMFLCDDLEAACDLAESQPWIDEFCVTNAVTRAEFRRIPGVGLHLSEDRGR